MTNTTTDTAVHFFIAVSADSRSQITIDGIGITADLAIADALASAGYHTNARPDEMSVARDVHGDIITDLFIAQECTEALFDRVALKGGAGLSWYRNDQGLQDLEKEGETAELVFGSTEDLIAQLIKSGKDFDEEDAPERLFVQLSHNDGWHAKFATKYNYYSEMTDWSTGEDVAKLYADILAGNRDAVADYAANIERVWEAAWTD